MVNPDGWFRFCWDLLLLFFSLSMLVIVPVLVCFYAPALECTFLAGPAERFAAEPFAPPQPAATLRFMSVANAFFLVRAF
jgi:hypothetical protein